MVKNLAILCLFVTLAVATPILSDEEEWQQFKNVHHKLYQTNEEEALRYEIFKDNLKKIREHNEEYERGETSWQMAVNKFTDLTPEEFKKIYAHGLLPKDDEGNVPRYA